MGVAMSEEETRPTEAGRSRARELLWVVVVWGRLVIGLALAAIAGVVFGHAWTSARGSLWWVGGITLLTGGLLILSCLYTRCRVEELPVELEILAQPEAAREPLVPLLGALLVYKFRYLSHEQLNRALLKRRTEYRGQRRLGQVLVEMGYITQSQLQEALDLQESYARSLREARETPLV